ncbi:pilin N-terminal domain-containing protein [Lacticaseibacillus hulanensis]|uniref:pilin N-terminal domain-containing protein n=1 Tax=Lacticaseibacillus hulanensis TaxID=2493111 RepID=UPI000FDAA0EE|nr:pilin N-terminal domain-containing protein [Lacticaseibacillus hulanensis]
MRQFIKRIRILAASMLLAVLIGLLAAAPVRGQAAETSDTVDVVLHKLVFAPDAVPADTTNDGHTNPFGDQGSPLNGVTFTAYDVTQDFWSTAPQTEAAMTDAQNRIAAADYVAHNPVKAVTTSGEGTAEFGGLPMHSHGMNAVYLFRETQAPKGVTGTQNLVIVLPVKGAAGRIDLYPKNVGPETPIETGGQRFVKVDADDYSEKLAGAEFVVRNADGEYLTKKQKWQVVTGTITDSNNTQSLLTLQSKDDGSFAIDGLPAGDYELVEVRAPEGYMRSEHPVDFTIVPGKYSSAVAAINVVNAQSPWGYPPLPNTGIFGKLRHLLPKTFGWLPQTGSARATWLTILGIFLLVSLLIGRYWYKRVQAR